MSDFIPLSFQVSSSKVDGFYTDTSDFRVLHRLKGAPCFQPRDVLSHSVETPLSYEKLKHIICSILDDFKSSYVSDTEVIAPFTPIDKIDPEVLASLGFGKDKFPYVKFSYEFDEENSKYIVFCQSNYNTVMCENTNPQTFLRYCSKCMFEVNVYQTYDGENRIVEVNRLREHSNTYIRVFQEIKKVIEEMI